MRAGRNHVDIFSRYIVGWTVENAETAETAKTLIAGAVERHDITPGQLTIHADRSTSMPA